MSTPTVYVLCDQNCKREGMTKEQILAAITQAVESHEISDVDTGFVTTLKTVNGIALSFFIGTQEAWAQWPSDQKDGVFAIFTNDTTGDAIKLDIEQLQAAVDNILDGTQPVQKATNAENTDFTNSEWTTITSDSYEDISDTDFRRYKFSAPLSENLQRKTLEITVQDQNGVLPILSLGVAQMPKVTGNTAKNKKTMVSYQKIYLHAAQTKVQTFNVVFESLDTGVAGINVSILSDYKVNVAFELSYRKIR